MKNGKILAALAVIATSAALLTACLGSQDGGTDSADSPSVKSDQADNVGAQSSQSRLSQERQDDPKPSRPAGQLPALSSNQAAPGPGKLSPPKQESRTADQITGVAPAITADPDPSAQAQAAPSPLSEAPGDTPLQSSKAVEVNLRQFRQLLPKDAIPPVYTPQFLPANQASMEPEELVIGVEIDGESKAYPIGPLVRREMVNDVISGVPILVTW